MDEKELRIGNFIVIHGVLHFVDLELLTVISHNNIHIEGLPITPEILEKAGFVKCQWPQFDEYTHMMKDELTIRFHHDGASIFNLSKCDGKTRQFVRSVRYVHEFQNGYYFLTGEELEINL